LRAVVRIVDTAAVRRRTTSILLSAGILMPALALPGTAGASLTATSTTPAAGRALTLTARGSVRPGTSYRWDTDGNGAYELDTGAINHVETNFPAPGDVVVGVQRSDGQATDSLAIHVGTATTVGAIGVEPASPVVGQETLFFTQRAPPADATTTWDLDGDGAYETASRPTSGLRPGTSRTFAETGTYLVGVKSVTTTSVAVFRVLVAVRPAAPTPPPGPVGIAINGGARFTATRDVQVQVVWPQGAESAILSDHGCFCALGTQRTYSLPATNLAWRLGGTGDTATPTTVWVHFGPAAFEGGDRHASIVLDLTDPKLRSAARSRDGRQLVLRATDTASGVLAVQTSANRRTVSRTYAYARTVLLRRGDAGAWVRVADRVGHLSRWTRVPRPKDERAPPK
jgi:hypothetical protein